MPARASDVERWIGEYAAETGADPDGLRDWLSDADLDSFDASQDFMSDTGKREQPAFFRWWRDRHQGIRQVQRLEAAYMEQLKDLPEKLRAQLAHLASVYGMRVHRHHGKDKDHVRIALELPAGLYNEPTLASGLAVHFCGLCGKECGAGVDENEAKFR